MTCPYCKAAVDSGASTCAACGRDLARPQVGPGSLVASRYRLLQELGAGGMGVVFKAHDQSLDEVVALKLLRADLSLEGGTTDAERAAALASRFRSEIKLAWKVRHRNVCGIHEYGEDGHLLYISMELVDGRDLRRILREKGALLWEQAYDVGLQVAEGLAAIHDAGVIHRDLKPANMMLDAKGVVRLMDFGIAKVWGAESGAGLTESGHVVGSPEYMSPEQVRDRPLDFRSDLYTFGVVLFELFTGRVPFKADTPLATMLKHLEEPPPLDGPHAARIPSALLPILRRALEKGPDGRYSTCAQMRSALEAARRALHTQPTPAVPMPIAVRAPSGASPAQLLVPYLVRALKHKDPAVRHDAAEALGSIGAEREQVLAPLQEARERDDDPNVRAAAEAALRRLGPAPMAATSPPPVSSTAPTPAWTPAPRSVSQQAELLPAIDRTDDRPPSEHSHKAIIALVAAGLALLLALAVRAVLDGLRTDQSQSQTTALPTTLPSIDPPQPSPTSPIASAPPPSPVTTTSPVAPPTSSPPRRRPSVTQGASPGGVGQASPFSSKAPSPVTPSLTPETTTTTTTQPPPESTPIEPSPAPPVPIPSPSPPPRVQAGDLVQLTDPGVVRPNAWASNAAAHTMISLELVERFGLKGSVELRVLVDEKGEVAKIDVLRVTTRPEGAEYEKALKSAALKGVSKWRFDPARADGVVVRVWLPVRIEF